MLMVSDVCHDLTNCLLLQTTLRVWDCLFYEGAKIMFRVGLAVIKMNQNKFLACNSFTEIMDLFKEIPKSKEVLNCHQFLEVNSRSFSLFFKEQWSVGNCCMKRKLQRKSSTSVPT